MLDSLFVEVNVTSLNSLSLMKRFLRLAFSLLSYVGDAYIVAALVNVLLLGFTLNTGFVVTCLFMLSSSHKFS